MVRLLLDRGAAPNLADAMGNTAQMAAASKGRDRELMKMLITAGARAGATNKADLSAFEMRLFFGHKGLEELIAAGYRCRRTRPKPMNRAPRASPPH